jgi:hypothetical protein
MSPTRFYAGLNTYHHVDPFRDAGIAADSLTGIHNAMVKCLLVVSRSCIHKVSRSPHR